MTEAGGAPKRKYKICVSEEVYEELDGGLVRVTARDGRTGTFRCDGRWLEGDLREANLNMLIFCGGPNVPTIFNYRWPEVPAAIDRPSGWPEAHERHLKNVGIG
ncbi:MAG: hypothetical protein JWO15_2233 [Sphingomonadales bacterium]|jgi:hypothetical protein|nr:hypothetical protein [Sphingomonadales bacterium]